METVHVLFAEDDVNLGKVLTTYLTKKGFEIDHANNGESAYDKFCTGSYDICIIDVMMPLMDGFTLAQEIRKLDKRIPIIFLTAKNLQEDMIKGLSIGGDDYITKPFAIDVLLARIQALLRRTTPEKEEDSIIELGSITFNKKRQTLTINGEETKITTREAELLTDLCNSEIVSFELFKVACCAVVISAFGLDAIRISEKRQRNRRNSRAAEK